jgi:hypothetical protein
MKWLRWFGLKRKVCKHGVSKSVVCGQCFYNALMEVDE